MRIIAGSFSGRRLAAVGKGEAGAHLRPTTDRLRESLFNMLSGGRFGDPFEGAHVLDLFAGTGALGLEALSRGAAYLTLVDDGRVAQSLIRQNIALCGVQSSARLIRRDARRLAPTQDVPANLVFLDPPYQQSLGAPALEAAAKGGWIAKDALIVWEERGAMAAPDGFDLIETKAYGDTVFTLMRAR